MVQKGNLAFIEGHRKGPNLQNRGGHAHQKIGLHAFQINLYLHEYLEQILFLTPTKRGKS